jgi:hypothetical protein
MAAAVGFSSSISSSSAESILSSGALTASTAQLAGSSSESKAPTKTDSVDLSRAALLLNQVDQQITASSPTGFREILRSAAVNVLQAAGESDQAQAAALENLAGRLQVAADASGISGMTSFSLISILGN